MCGLWTPNGAHYFSIEFMFGFVFGLEFEFGSYAGGTSSDHQVSR